MSSRAFTEKLEKVINQGVELRDEMRAKIESLEALVHRQKMMIDQVTDANEIYRLRVKNYIQRVHKLRIKNQVAVASEARLQKKLDTKTRQLEECQQRGKALKEKLSQYQD